MTKALSITFIASAIILSIISFSFIRKTSFSHSKDERSMGTLVFSDMKTDNIKTVRITKAKSDAVTLCKGENTWTVENLHNYPADTTKLSDLLQEVANLRIIQNVQLASHAYEKLDLLPLDSTDTNNTAEIQFFDGENKLLYSLLVGKKRFATNPKDRKQIVIGRYVRVPSQKKIIFTDELFNEVNFSANDWLYDPDISINNIKAVALAKNAKTEWVLTRESEKENFTFKEASVDQVPNAQKVTAITNSLNSLKFNSVANKKLSLAETGLSSPVTINVTTFDGVRHRLQIGKVAENNRYVKLSIIANDKKLTEKQLQKQKYYSEWIYLVDINRLDPLMSSKESLLKKEGSRRAPTSIYSQPIS